MLLTIGILAHNEEAQIGTLVEDIASQSILHNPDLSIEIRVVANGCTDRTVAVAQAAFAKDAFAKPNIKSFVHDLHESGKSNAWNHLIHRYASPQSDYIILLDADIRLPEATTLALLFEGLAHSNSAVVAVDESVKDLTLKPSLTFVERLILKASGTAHDTRTALAGGCYCAKFNALRDIWMPIGLPGEDGFLRAMLLTSSFTADEDLNRLLFVPGARHIFESERRIRDVFRHNVRLAIGTAINVLLFHHFRAHPRNAQALATYIQERNMTDPKWINTLVAEQRRSKRYFVMPGSILWRRPKRLAALPPVERISKAPIFLMGFVFDLALYLRANHLMRRGVGAGFW
jgi:glycosyltransferase involved in cell wall biosynthesis